MSDDAARLRAESEHGVPVIVERSPEAKRAYAEGYKAGWKWALDGIRRGLLPETVEEACSAISGQLSSALKDLLS